LDFDHSLLEFHNTDVYIFEKLQPKFLDEHDEETEYRSRGDWNSLMNIRFKKLASTNITKEEIITCFENCLLSEPAIDYLKLFHQNNVPVHIVSDSNTLFISTILKASGVDNLVTKIHTNPHQFTGNELSIGKYHQNSICELQTCPKNICKGAIVKDVLQSIQTPPKIKIYVGDGSNDFCPCQTCFGLNDLIFAKKKLSFT